jgi:Zeta toxin
VTSAGGLRDSVAAQLTDLSSPGQALHANSDRRTEVLYAGDSVRASFHRDIIADYLSRASPLQDGRSAIITAGPPGVGKSTALHAEVVDLDTYRVLDADIVKGYLVERAVADGIYGDLLKYDLADGYRIAPGELAALVHDESVQLIERIREICVLQRENIVVEATLQWDGHGPAIFSELALADYTHVRILGVEADRDLVHAQALDRWWTRRTEWTTGKHPLGGRFVPPAVIDKCYPPAGRSYCAQHAIDLIDRAKAGEIENVHLTLYRHTGSGPLQTLADEHVRS